MSCCRNGCPNPFQIKACGGYCGNTCAGVRGRLFYHIERGISLGRPLSPLMGALFLQTLDERMEQLGLFYLRPLLLIESY